VRADFGRGVLCAGTEAETLEDQSLLLSYYVRSGVALLESDALTPFCGTIVNTNDTATSAFGAGERSAASLP
jgi:hypothetical protein